MTIYLRSMSEEHFHHLLQFFYFKQVTSNLSDIMWHCQLMQQYFILNASNNQPLTFPQVAISIEDTITKQILHFSLKGWTFHIVLC